MKQIINKCMSNEIKSSDVNLLDLLSSYDNIMVVICELAHKEIVQKTQYVVDCWKDIITPLKVFFTTIESFDEFYSTVTPKTAKVITIIQSDPSIHAGKECLSHLKIR